MSPELPEQLLLLRDLRPVEEITPLRVSSAPGSPLGGDHYLVKLLRELTGAGLLEAKTWALTARSTWVALPVKEAWLAEASRRITYLGVKVITAPSSALPEMP